MQETRECPKCENEMIEEFRVGIYFVGYCGRKLQANSPVWYCNHCQFQSFSATHEKQINKQFAKMLIKEGLFDISSLDFMLRAFDLTNTKISKELNVPATYVKEWRNNSTINEDLFNYLQNIADNYTCPDKYLCFFINRD